VATAAVALVTLLAWAPQLRSTPRRLACTVLPNLLVPVIASPDGSCPLWAYDRVRSVERAGAPVALRSLAALEAALPSAGGTVWLEVERNGERMWRGVPVVTETPARQVGRFVAATVVAGILVATGLLVFWNATARAAAPFLVFYGCVSVLAVAVLSGRASYALVVAQLAATGAIPASLVHLALTFPRERDLVGRMPSIVIWPYAAAAALVALQLASFEGSPSVWRSLDRVLLAAGIAAWSVLVLGCLLALRESVSSLERARARVLLRGVALVPAVLVGLTLLVPNALPAGGAARAGLGVIALPLPIGYAIARYQLFDLGRDVRGAIVYLLQLAAAAGLIALACKAGHELFGVALPVDDPMILFAFTFLGLLVSDPLRVLLRGLLDGFGSPQRSFLRQLAEEQTERLAELRPPEEQAEILCGAALLGLGARGASLFLQASDAWTLACASGESASIDPTLASAATLEVGHEGPLHLARLEGMAEGSPLAALQRAGVEVLAPVRWGDATLGCLLVAASRNGVPYTREHLAFLRGITTRAAVALQNGALLQDLVAAERFATLGRVAAGLAHEIGKPLGVLQRLAQRLPERADDRARVERDASAMASLAGEMRSTVQGLLGAVRREATGREPGARLPVEALLERAVAEVSRLHGPGRIARRLDPSLPELPSHAEPLVRVLVNLLDNGLRASAPGEVVELCATASERELRIEVIDHGNGMSAGLLRLTQQPFFSTRAPGAGTGLGLFVARRIVRTLGGSLALRSIPGVGTRALVSLPLPQRDLGAPT
jgi:signal transduction histidine kinase